MSKRLALLKTSLFLFTAVSGQSTKSPVVSLDYGSFTGLTNATSGITYYRGIRYADAPVGDLRWRAPVSPPSMHLGEVDATKFANICVQTTQTSLQPDTSEDCLFGNVNLPPGTTPDARLPVMVWFHGGGFQGGSTHDAPPDFLLQSSASPMLFVSFEYRLGQFGFLGGPQIKGNGILNAGLLDQRAALRWVQRYIHHFGGDNRRVTIWGESAGAGSTMFHLLGNRGNDEGLFHAAMGDSPSLSFLPLYTDPYVEGIFEQFASFAGCGGLGERTLSCLRSASSSVLTLAGSKTISARTATLFTFAPIIDESFLSERPVEAFANGTFAHVPVLFGSNTNEGSRWSATLRDASANTSMPNATETTVYNFIRGQYPDFTTTSFNRAVEELYPLEDFNGSFSLQGQQMYGEVRYICTAGLISGAVGERGEQVAYQFRYDNPHLGSDHGSDLTAFYTPPGSPGFDESDDALFEGMREDWASFVTGGNPVARSLQQWNPVTDMDGSPRILLRPGGVAMEKVSDGLAERCGFWHSIADELHV